MRRKRLFEVLHLRSWFVVGACGQAQGHGGDRVWHHGGGHVCKGCLSVGTEHNQTPSSLHKGDFITLKGQTGGVEGSVSGRVCVCVCGVSAASAKAAAGVSAELVFKGKRGKEICAWMS